MPTDPTKPLTLSDLRDTVQNKYEQYLMETWRRMPSSTARASGIGNQCRVRQVLEIARPEAEEPPNIEFRGVCWTGNMTETDTKMALEQISKDGSFELSHAQESLTLVEQIPGTTFNVVVLSGHIDNRISAKGLVDEYDQPIKEGIPFEIKTLKPEVWEKVANGDLDSLVSSAWWAEKWVWQAQSYCLMTGSAAALLFVVSKQHRLPMVFVVHADEKMQATIRQRAVDVFLLLNSDLDEVIGRATFMPTECPGCPFFRNICTVKGGSPVVDILEEEVKDRVLRLYEAKVAIAGDRTALERADKKLSKELKALLTSTDDEGNPTGVELARLADGSFVKGKLVEVGPKTGYSFWKCTRSKPKERNDEELTALQDAQGALPEPKDNLSSLIRPTGEAQDKEGKQRMKLQAQKEALEDE